MMAGGGDAAAVVVVVLLAKTGSDDGVVDGARWSSSRVVATQSLKGPWQLPVISSHPRGFVIVMSTATVLDALDEDVVIP